MPHQEKSIYASLATTLVIFGNFYWRIFDMYGQGLFEGPNASSLVGQSVLWLIVAGVVVSIIAHIVVSIVFAIATNDAKPSFVVDERDKLIELRALRVSYYVFGAGFVTSMIALAMGQAPFVVFILLISSFAVASVVESIVQLFLYRRGF